MPIKTFQKSGIIFPYTQGGSDFIGKIRDPLHDTIPYTLPEKIIIDKPEFQRLRRINQTAFTRYVFPGATHTRFEHSLGAMHIAGLFYSALIANQKRIINTLHNSIDQISPNLKNKFASNELKNGSLIQTQQATEFMEKSHYLAQCLRFAALLHDCGHSPLSHSGERFMPTWNILSQNLEKLNLPDWLDSALKSKMEQIINKNETIRHEIYTLLIIQQLFQSDDELLSANMGRDICSILDTSIQPCPESDLEKSQLQNLFNEIVSGEIDVDRMDYLLRDSQECGVVYGYFDLGRLLDSIGFYIHPETQKAHLALRRSGISAYEDFLRARLSMYQQVYFHKTATACEAMLEHLKINNPSIHFPVDINAYTKLDDWNFKNFLINNVFENERIFTENFLSKLLFERKLWKRVYEESILSYKANQTPNKCHNVLKLLEKLEIPAILIESTTNLTRFSPKSRTSFAKNNFKVIVKNVNSLKFLEPIENHSHLVNRIDEEIMIRRIFVAKYNYKNEEIDIQKIKKIISESLYLESNSIYE